MYQDSSKEARQGCIIMFMDLRLCSFQGPLLACRNIKNFENCVGIKMTIIQVGFMIIYIHSEFLNFIFFILILKDIKSFCGPLRASSALDTVPTVSPG